MKNSSWKVYKKIAYQNWCTSNKKTVTKLLGEPSKIDGKKWIYNFGYYFSFWRTTELNLTLFFNNKDEVIDYVNSVNQKGKKIKAILQKENNLIQDNMIKS